MTEREAADERFVGAVQALSEVGQRCKALVHVRRIARGDTSPDYFEAIDDVSKAILAMLEERREKAT